MTGLAHGPDALSPAQRLIVALDMKDESAVLPFVDALGDEISFYKVGYLRVFSRGLGIARELHDRGKQVFLDLKFFDVPQTVASNIGEVAGLGVSFATVHGNGAIIQAAREAAEGSDLKILAVTLLTSLSREDVNALYGLDAPTEESVVSMARWLVDNGCHGVIASPREAARLRGELDPGTLIVTPGVRLPGADSHDHQRSGDPRRAVLDGADYLVVGRPIHGAADPRAAAARHIDAIALGLKDRMDAGKVSTGAPNPAA